MTMGRSSVAMTRATITDGEDGQAAGVGEWLLVEAAGVGLVGPAHLAGRTAAGGA